MLARQWVCLQWPDRRSRGGSRRSSAGTTGAGGFAVSGSAARRPPGSLYGQHVLMQLLHCRCSRASLDMWGSDCGFSLARSGCAGLQAGPREPMAPLRVVTKEGDVMVRCGGFIEGCQCSL
jgi:hypothetical protein